MFFKIQELYLYLRQSDCNLLQMLPPSPPVFIIAVQKKYWCMIILDLYLVHGANDSSFWPTITQRRCKTYFNPQFSFMHTSNKMPITGRYSWLFEPLLSAQAAQAPFLESGRQQEQFQGVFSCNPNMLVLPAVSSPTAPCSNSVRSHLKARQWTCLMLSFINHRLEFLLYQNTEESGNVL